MARILATNGTHERLMGYAELQQNPNWWPVNGAGKAVTTQPAPVSKPAKSGPKEVKTPETVVVEETPAQVRTAPETEPAQEQPAPEVVAPATASKSIPEMVKAIREATTVEQVNAVVAGDTRETVIKVAEKRIKDLRK